MALVVDVSDKDLSAIAARISAWLLAGYPSFGQDIQMYRDPPSSQIIHSQDTAYDVSPECIKHKDLPYRLAIGVQDRCRLRDQAVARAGIMVQFGLLRHVIEVQDALYRS